MSAPSGPQPTHRPRPEPVPPPQRSLPERSLQQRGVRGAFARRPILWFWIIATAINIVIVPVILLSGALESLDRASQETGIPLNTDLRTAFRLVVAEPAAIPGIVLSLIQIAAPDIAVLVVVGLGLGRARLREVGRRFRFWSPEVGARRGLLVWAACVATFLVTNLGVAGLRSLLLSDVGFAFDWSTWLPGLVGALLVGMFLDAGGLFEENGWRGFMQPAVQQRYGPFVASLVVGVAWGLWHLPVKIDIWLNYGFLGGVAIFAMFTASLVAVSIVISFFFNRAGEATIIAVAMHGLFNDSRGIAGLIDYTTFRDELLDLTCLTVAFGIVAAVLTVATRGRLGAPCLDKAR